MMNYSRILDLKKESENKSIFLFGPRQTGKTFLIRETLPDSPYYNLLLADLYLRLSRRPQLLREELLARKNPPRGPVVIDEIQKLPMLLDEVHNLIEDRGMRFILTGSCARKLRRGGANLLGGRARTRYLYPLVSREIPGFELDKALNTGTIPSMYLSEEPEQDLLAYCGTYLQEEILAEGLIRNIGNFSRFLQIAALSSAELLNFENVASDCGVPSRTVREYFRVLEDTLIGCLVHPYKKTSKRKAVSRPKFYLFDVGVSNSIAGRKALAPKTELYGKALEQFIFTEIRAYLSYAGDRRQLTFWRSRSGYEVDFLIGDDTAIEVKATDLVTGKHLKGLRALAEEKQFANRIVVSLDSSPRDIGDVSVLPVHRFLENLWAKTY